MHIEYELIEKSSLKDSHRKIFADLLGKQGKVKNPLGQKADRCRVICIASIDGVPVAIGGIKEKTKSDFDSKKSGLPELADEFEWELGYLYTEEAYRKRGISKAIARLLSEHCKEFNLMSTTEISANPAMVSILEGLGFRLFGKPWKSGIHDNFLGLFLRFKSGE